MDNNSYGSAGERATNTTRLDKDFGSQSNESERKKETHHLPSGNGAEQDIAYQIEEAGFTAQQKLMALVCMVEGKMTYAKFAQRMVSAVSGVTREAIALSLQLFNAEDHVIEIGSGKRKNPINVRTYTRQVLLNQVALDAAVLEARGESVRIRD